MVAMYEERFTFYQKVKIDPLQIVLLYLFVQLFFGKIADGSCSLMPTIDCFYTDFE